MVLRDHQVLLTDHLTVLHTDLLMVLHMGRRMVSHMDHNMYHLMVMDRQLLSHLMVDQDPIIVQRGHRLLLNKNSKKLWDVIERFLRQLLLVQCLTLQQESMPVP